MFRLLCPVLLLLALSACSSGGGDAGNYVGGSVPLECAPFARALSGIRLAGAAADWWSQAEGRYLRGNTPSIGSVLVLQRSDRLPSGHVAVVSQVIDSRQILVTQANWVHHRVTEDQPVIDVLRQPMTGRRCESGGRQPAQMGVTDYPAYGFIRAGSPGNARPAHRRDAAGDPAGGERMMAPPGGDVRPRLRAGRAPSHRPASRDRSSRACRAPMPRRRTGSSGCRARRSASSR